MGPPARHLRISKSSVPCRSSPDCSLLSAMEAPVLSHKTFRGRKCFHLPAPFQVKFIDMRGPHGGLENLPDGRTTRYRTKTNLCPANRPSHCESRLSVCPARAKHSGPSV